MPALSRLFTQGTDGSTVAGALANANCTSPVLTNGATYFVSACGNIHNTSSLPEGYGAELEARFGSSRLSICRFPTPLGNFNTADSTGGQLQMFAVVTGDGTNALNMQVRSTAAVYPTTLYGACQWLAINLTGLVEAQDFWIGDAELGDVTEVDTAATVMQARCVRIADPSGTPTTTVLGPGEPWVFTPDSTDPTLFGPTVSLVDATPLTAGTTYTFRWEFDDAGWVQGDVGGQITFTPTVSGVYAVYASAEAHIASGTTISYRRTRIFILRLGALSNYVVHDTAGNFAATSGTAEGSQLSHNFAAGSHGVAVHVCAPHGITGNWSDFRLINEGTPDVNYPPGDGVAYLGDYPPGLCFAAADVSGAQTWRLSATAEAGGTITVGQNSSDSGAARTVIIALYLDAPLTGAAAIVAPAPVLDASGTVTSSGATLTGTVEMTAPGPVLDAAGSVTPGPSTLTGSAALVAPGPLLALLGALSSTRAGSISLTAPSPLLVVDGTVVGLRTGTVEMTAPAPLLLAYETVPVEAVSLPSLPFLERAAEAAYYPTVCRSFTRGDDALPSLPTTFSR